VADLAHSAAAERNKGAILEVLGRVLPARGAILEVASGTGQHVVHFAQKLPDLTWQPSDPDPSACEAIESRVLRSGLGNIKDVVSLDVRGLPWPVTHSNALICINMVHISPWAATEALFENARGHLAAGCVLYLYGPYRRADYEIAPSNEAFDASLRAQNPAWGLRYLEDVARTAGDCGFNLEETVEMPANNLSLIFRRESE